MSQVLSCQAMVEDKEVSQIEVRVTLKDGLTERPSSMVIERATMKWLADHVPSWTTYCIENSMKTL